MNCVLITGGAGFIGSCLVRLVLQDRRLKVVNLDKLTYAGNLDSLAGVLDDPHHCFVQGDIGDEQLVRKLLAVHQPRAVVNLAAESHVDRSIDAPAPFVETNIVGTFRLLTAVHQWWSTLDAERRARFRFVQVSTDEVYGSLGPAGSFVETSPYAPNSPYSASKAAADHFVRAFFRTYGLPTITTNCSNNYGPCQFPEKLIPLMILNALEGRPLPLYADGGNIRDWLFVEDHCRALLAAIEHGQPGEVYNIGGNCERTNLALVETLCPIVDELSPGLRHAPCANLITFVEDRPGHDRRYAVDSTKARRDLHWRPEVDLNAGLRLTVQWYRDHAAWVDRVASGNYQRGRLGLGDKNAALTTREPPRPDDIP